MLSDDLDLKAVEARMNALVRCVLAKAETDKEFAGQLKEILLSDSLRASLRVKKGGKPKRAIFDPIAFLGNHDSESLRKELDDKHTPQLVEIARKHRVIPAKMVKGIEREELLAKIIDHAKRKLDQGSVFLRSRLQTETSLGEALPNDPSPSQGTTPRN